MYCVSRKIRQKSVQKLFQITKNTVSTLKTCEKRANHLGQLSKIFDYIIAVHVCSVGLPESSSFVVLQVV